MIKVTMVDKSAEATFVVSEMSEAWVLIAPGLLPGTEANIHAESMETGEVLFLFQDGAIKHMEAEALTGFLDMVYEVNPLLAMAMALDLLATMEAAGLGE